MSGIKLKQSYNFTNTVESKAFKIMADFFREKNALFTSWPANYLRENIQQNSWEIDVLCWNISRDQKNIGKVNKR